MGKISGRELRRRVAANVRRLRAGLGWTQMEAAARAGMHWRSWQRVEARQANLGIDALLQVAVALGVDAVDLLRPLAQS